MRSCHCQVSSCPETNIIRQSSSRAVHEISDALQAGELHVISGLFQTIIRFLLARRITRKQTLDHKLQKAVLRGQLGASAKCRLPDSVDRIALWPVFSRQPYTDVILSQPFQQTDKTGIDF